MERFSFIFLVAGLGFFSLAFGISAYLPMLTVEDLKVKTIADLAKDVPSSFVELKEQYPQSYRKAFYQSTDEQTIGLLNIRYPELFKNVFSKNDEQALQFIKDSAPKVYSQVFGDEATLDEAIEMMDDDREEVVESLKKVSQTVHDNAFILSIQSAVATLRANYRLTLLKIRKDNPEAYRDVFEQKEDSAVFAEALTLGHNIYIGEGCWHCHSQQIRPWGKDETRYGQISYPEEYHNELNKPPLWGTRRIGPDLVRRGGKNSNDWHVAHFWNPKDINPVSVMPPFPWFFEDDGLTPNKRGLSIIAYVQWLGSWQNSREETVHQIGDIERLSAQADKDREHHGDAEAQR